MKSEMVFVVTAVGVLIDTQTRVAKTMDKAKKIASELFKEYGMDVTEAQEMTSRCWKGFSQKCACDVEIEIHENCFED